MDVLGCWTCHGRASSGAGGEGEPLQGTLLPLSLFVKELRLPAETMPPFSPLVATDDELAIVYAWLEGADPVVAPPPVRLSLVGVGGEPAGAGVELELELELTAVAEASALADASAMAEASAAAEASALAEREPLRVSYRVTLFERDNELVAHLPLRYGSDEAGWTELTTDAYGQVVLGPEEGVPLSDLARAGGASSRLRLPLSAGPKALIVEALAAGGSAEPTILGIGSAVLDPS